MKIASWHCHHEVLCEWDIYPRENRIAYIKSHKPAHEQELRLRLYQPMGEAAIAAWAEYEKVKKPAWAEYEKVKQAAWAEYEKVAQPAWAEYEKVQQAAWAEYEKVKQAAWAEYEKVKQAAWAPLEAIHKIECPNCPWNGQTTFPDRPVEK
jgi:hypothetical protein